MKNWNVEKYTKRGNLWNIQSKLSATEDENVRLLVLFPWRTRTLKFSRQIPVVRGPQQHRKIRRRIRSLEGCYKQRSLRTSTLVALDSSQNSRFFSNEAIGTVVARIRDVAIDPRNERRHSVSNFPARFPRVSRSAAKRNGSISSMSDDWARECDRYGPQGPWARTPGPQYSAKAFATIRLLFLSAYSKFRHVWAARPKLKAYNN